MRRIALSILAGLALVTLNAQTMWNFDRSHMSVTFDINYMGITAITGSFNSFNGQVMAEKEDFSDAQIEFNIDAKSINTGNERRDNHLRGEDYFHVEKYPEITIKSKSLEMVSENNFNLTCDIKMHGETKEITLAAIFNGIVIDKRENTRAGFAVTGTLNRFDFGFTNKSSLANGTLVQGKDISISCGIQLIKVKE